MQIFNFLTKRQAGIDRNVKSSNGGSSLNLDPVLSRLVCWRKDCHVVQGRESDVPPFASKFNKDSNSTDLLAVASEDGDILVYDTFKEGDQALLKSFRAHNNAIFDICWLPGKPQLITVSGDHFATLWNVETSQCISRFQKHVGSVKSVDVCPFDSALFATGSRDGSINVWDTRIDMKNSYGNSYKPVITINDAHSRKEKWKELSSSGLRKRMTVVSKTSFCSVTAVAFQDCYNLASAGVADGVVKIWDLRKTYNLKNNQHPNPRYEMSYCKQRTPAHGCTSLVFDSRYKNLYACCTSNVIHQFDCHSHDLVPKSSYTGFRGATYFIKLALSCDDQYLLCGSSDEKAYIWKVSRPGLPIFQLPGHTAEVSSVAWNQNDVSKLVTCGDDSRIHVWKSFGGIENVEKNEEILATCSAYIQVEDPNSPSAEDDITEVTQTDIQSNVTLSNSNTSPKRIVTPITSGPKKCRINSITNFFTPARPSPCSSSSVSPASSDVTETPVKTTEGSDNEQSPVSQILSPCKVLNMDNIMSQTSVRRTLSLEASNKERAASLCNLSLSTSSNSNSKENNSVRNKKSPPKSTQRKRKCPDTVPRAKSRKSFHGGKAATKKSVKKQRSSTEGTLMNYFCVEISPEKH